MLYKTKIIFNAFLYFNFSNSTKRKDYIHSETKSEFVIFLITLMYDISTNII